MTGGAGFIGSHVVDRLRAHEIEPRVFDLLPSPHHRDVDARVGDLGDSRVLRSAMAGCDAVLHLAAMADADRAASQPAAAEAANSRGTLNVLEAARDTGVGRIVYASTIWVYSDAGRDEVDEDTALGLPAHLYTATKLAGEMYCRSYAELYGIDYTILRFGIPYGPRCRPEAVVPRFVARALAGEPVTVAGDGRQSRPFVYVEDLAEGAVLGLRDCAANRVYNLVGDEDVTILDIAEAVQREVGPVRLAYVPGRAGDLRSVKVSGQRAAAELGWRARTQFAEGLRRYLAWHRDQEEVRETAAAPASAGEPLNRRLGELARRALPATLLGVLAAVVMTFLWLVHTAGGTGDDVHTAALTTMLGLTVYLAVAVEGQGSMAGVPWVLGAICAVLILRWPHDLTRLATSDLDLIALGLTGAAFGVAAGVAGQRVARAQLREST